MQHDAVLRDSARRRVAVDATHLVDCGGLMAIGIGSTLNDRFLLDRELGHGGMGSVYSALDQILQRRVAVKVLKEQSGTEVGRRLRLEAQILARLLHDNIVRLYDFGQTEGSCYLVMEEVDGLGYNRRWRSLSPIDRLETLAGVAEALHYAHQQGVIHRDVKPANVLLTGTGRPKLSDFGLSMVVDQGDEEGIVRGTPHYMSPEQARGKKIDHRSDLYSLGVMLYEATTGKLPFTGEAMQILAQHIGSQPVRPILRAPDLSEPLDDLIVSLTSKSPAARPISGAVVARLLRDEIERRRRDQTGAAEEAQPSSSPPSSSVRIADQGGAEARSGRVVDADTLAGLAEASDAPVEAPRTRESRISPSPNDAPARPASVSISVSDRTPGSGIGSGAGAGPIDVLELVANPLVRKMLETVLAEPLVLSPDERYLHGHYLAYLLGGARRTGLLLRKPLDPRNADRARLLLAMSYVSCSADPEAAVAEAAQLLDARPEVRAALNPIVSAKYLAGRETPARRRTFRKHRQAIQAASEHARRAMTDDKGVLNPGLMPLFLDDLRKIAPPRTEVDDVLVERWNRVFELWRNHPEFRRAVLRYSSGKSARDPAGQAIWPEVVYPLIELGRMQRRSLSPAEAFWDYLRGRIFPIPDAGVLLDRIIRRIVPEPVVRQLDDSLELLVAQPPIEDFDAAPASSSPREPASRSADRRSGDGDDDDAAGMSAFRSALSEPEPSSEDAVPLADPDPIRLTQGELHELWKEALANLQAARPGGGPPAGHRPVSIGPYLLAVVPSIRGRAAGQVAVQGMGNKQLELTTPPVRTRGSAAKPLIAAWVYKDGSLVIVHLDFQNAERFVLWDARRSQELKIPGAAELLHELASRGFEAPAGLRLALSRRFKPQNPV